MLLPLLLRLCHLCARLHGRLCTIAITIFQDAILCQPASQPTNQLIPLMRKMREIYAEITRNNITDEMADTLSEQYDYFDKRKRFSRRINACHQFQIDGSILNGNVELIIGNLHICHSLSLSLSVPSYLHLKNGNFYLDLFESLDLLSSSSTLRVCVTQCHNSVETINRQLPQPNSLSCRCANIEQVLANQHMQNGDGPRIKMTSFHNNST